MVRWLLLFSIFLFLNSSIAQVSPPVFVQKVYDDLFSNLYATKQISKPKLRYFPEDKKKVVDYFSSSDGFDAEIQIGVEFINVIRSFGADSSNALAFVLGHEMAHIFLEQTNIYRVGGYADNQLTKKNNYLAKDTIYTAILESQADEQAIFYAHIGGYKVTHIAQEVLTRIYTHFKLNHKLRGYPPLEERLKIAHHSVLKMNALLERFEIANLSYVSGKYQISERIYTSILNEGFKSAEIYNNLGTSLLMQVIESDSTFQKYIWPIFIDSRSKLTIHTQRSTFGIDVEDYLNKAINNFENANRFKGYKYSQLNLCIAHLVHQLKGSEDGVDHLESAREALNKLKNFDISRYNTLNAIYLHFTGEIEQAKNEFTLNVEKDPIAKRNLDQLYFNISQVTGYQNPLSKILIDSVNLVNLFYTKKGEIIWDTTTKILNSFANTSLDKLYLEGIKAIRFNNRTIGKLYIVSYENKFNELTENQLISFADEIIYTNLFRYYTYNDWVVRYDASGTKTVYLLTFNN
jgi:hypothetical protein